MERLADMQYRVCGLDLPQRDERSENRTAIPQTGRQERFFIVNANVGSLIGMERAVAEASEYLGGLDGLVCAAGVMRPDDGDLLSVTEDAWNKTFEVNVKGCWSSSRAAISYLRDGSQPTIVMISSITALRGSRTPQIAYTASKGAVSALARELAVSLADIGIRVNSICPGPLDGGVLASRIASRSDKERRISGIPMGRLGVAADVASACAFLVSEEAAHISGIELVVDGGTAAAF
jgi:NAD(P)-dependent dehydrogenase (short-subunit alcohol dehydrogenase family)